jgi:polygalacturonase
MHVFLQDKAETFAMKTWLIFPCLILATGASALASLPLVSAGQPPAAEAIDPAAAKRFVISDFGAVGDGITLNTITIQKAIDVAATAGGGKLVVPKGTFLSGAIFLKKGVDLWLDEGAVLLGSQDIADYPKQRTRIEGHFQDWRVALVNVPPMDRVRIGGQGQLNGNGAPFWAAFRAARGATNLDIERPRLMFIDRCSDVRVEGISFQDSGFWNLHLYNCHDVVIDGLRINAPAGSPSTDGIDVDSCQNVVIRKCQISNNDDDIALKGSKGPRADQDADSPAVENILIEDCEIGNGNGLVTCGSEATVVRHVTVRNCTITGGATCSRSSSGPTPRSITRTSPLTVSSSTAAAASSTSRHGRSISTSRANFRRRAAWTTL